VVLPPYNSNNFPLAYDFDESHHILSLKIQMRERKKGKKMVAFHLYCKEGRNECLRHLNNTAAL
jgi:hypothetical protein